MGISNYFMDTATTKKHRAIDAGPYDQSQVTEEPCDVKASSTVLQTNRCGDAVV
jgi:hypothetical protein